MKNYYIASCVFTERHPDLSLRIQNVVRERGGLETVRCCVPNYKLREFEERIPAGKTRLAWQALPDSGDFQPGDTVYSLCHNCNNIFEEMHPGVRVRSLWEWIAEDPGFPLKKRSGAVYVQDCWRAKDRRDEQDAVRRLLAKMGYEVLEAPENRARTDFCGNSLYRPQPPRNPLLAPKHYRDGAAGKFIPHSPEEQEAIMREYARRFGNVPVVCYCHYCLEGLRLGGARARHLAELLFSD